MRHAEPDVVADYNRLLAMGPPKCCHTCDFYDKNGTCVVFFMEPPEDFAATPSACPEWEGTIPF